MADILTRHRLLPGWSLSDLHTALRDHPATVIDMRMTTHPPMPEHPPHPVRLPAQWEPIQSVILNWPVFYPPLWALHAQMAEAILPVADVTITVPAPYWAHGIQLYLEARGQMATDTPATSGTITFMVIPTDDIWVRDYGPIVGLDADGQPVAFDPIYDHKPQYPQRNDDHMPRYWAAQTETTLHPLHLHTEGGNLWSDGAGTLLMTEQILHANPNHDRASLEAYLHRLFDFDKLIITPRLAVETTGHIDLLLKPADARTLLISDGTATWSGALKATADLFHRETNAQGEPYTLIPLPTPPLYFNWFVYPIRRSYTNALTVNGRLLLPVYGVETDQRAIKIYEQAMPDHTIIPIDCKIGANGGGAVHCMTKEIPRTPR